MAPSLICGGPGGQHLHSAGSYHLQLPQGPLIPGHLTVPGQKVGMASVLQFVKAMAQAWSQAVLGLGLRLQFNSRG